MFHFVPDNQDLEDFAKWNGFEGSDADLFYETYYGVKEEFYDDYEAIEAEASWESQ
jgi:hypothetical protein